MKFKPIVMFLMGIAMHLNHSGIYFYRLIVQGENGEAKFTQTRKMTFVK